MVRAATSTGSAPVRSATLGAKRGVEEAELLVS